MIQLSDHFRSDEKRRHSEWLRRRQWFIKARRDQVRQDQIIDRQEDDILSLATEATMATAIQIENFEQDIDAYDTAITTALIDNQKLLDAVIIQRDALLAQAYVMEDGRRIFKSEDGTYAIDENRQVVSKEEFDPGRIPDHLPRAPEFIKVDDIRLQLEENKQNLNEALERNNEAREWGRQPGRTAEELNERKSKLFAKLPASAKANLPDELNPAANVSDVKQDFSEKADSPKAATSPVISASKFEPGG